MIRLFNTAKIHIILQPIFLIFGFLWNSFLTKNLTVSDFGLFSLSLTLFSILSIFANFGMSAGLMRYIPLYEEKQKLNALKNVYYFSLFLPLVVGGFFYFLIVLFQGSLESAFIEDFTSLANILGIYIVLNAFVSSQMKIAITKGNFLYTKLHELVWHKVFPLVALYVLSLYVKITIVQVAYIYLAGYLFFALIFSKKIYSYYQKIELKKFKKIFNKDYFKYSFYISLSGLVSMLYMWSDNIMIGYFLNNYEVGIYSAVFLVAVIVRNFWYMAFVPILLPILSRYIAKKEIQNIKTTYDLLQRTLFILTIPLFLIFLYFGDELISLIFTIEYLVGMSSFYTLIFLYLLTIFFGYASYIISAYGDSKILFKVTLVSLAVNFLLNIVLIPKLGIIGAAIATGASELVYALICYFLTYKRYNLFIDSKIIYGLFISIISIFFLHIFDSNLEFIMLGLFLITYVIYSFIISKKVILLYKKGDK